MPVSRDKKNHWKRKERTYEAGEKRERKESSGIEKDWPNKPSRDE